MSNSNKIDTRFGSIWDELPNKTEREKSERNFPTRQSEAIEFFHAAEASITDSTMKIWDSHNDMMKKSAELRRVSERKKIIERQAQRHREQNQELMTKQIQDKEKYSEELKAETLKRK